LNRVISVDQVRFLSLAFQTIPWTDEPMIRFSPWLSVSVVSFALIATSSPLVNGNTHSISTISQKTPDSVTRYLDTLRRELGKRIQFAARRNNDQKLWAEVRANLNRALLMEWRSGKLKGGKSSQAFYVHCDRTTMTQADLDDGQLVVLLGVAPVRPAEFQIIRLTQRTTPAKNRVVWNQMPHH
jgi:hypothetical protein